MENFGQNSQTLTSLVRIQTTLESLKSIELESTRAAVGKNRLQPIPVNRLATLL